MGRIPCSQSGVSPCPHPRARVISRRLHPSGTSVGEPTKSGPSPSPQPYRPMSMLRLRQAAPAFLVAACLLLSACGGTEYPNSTFVRNTDLNTATDILWDKLLFWGTIVFVFVEGALVFTIIRFRKRPG